MLDRLGAKRFEDSVAAVMRRLKRVAEARYRTDVGAGKQA
jgi:hypothetical protein